MALPDFFQRGAVAVAQVIAGFDEGAIRDRLDVSLLRISISKRAARTSQGAATADLLVRLAARLYPAIAIDGPSEVVAKLCDLARSINPNIELRESGWATATIAVGGRQRPVNQPTLYVGSDGWTGRVSTTGPLPIGASEIPFGAGASACLAMASVFRYLFMDAPLAEGDVVLATAPESGTRRLPRLARTPAISLVGVGAVGNAAVWAISRLPDPPRIDLVDPETVDLSNLQRYVMTARDQVGLPKVQVAREHLPSAHTYEADLASYLAAAGFVHDTMAVSVDSAQARVAAQASLPRTLVNAWTQPGDLGVSAHVFDGQGACLACLYLPKAGGLSEDAIYAVALGIPEQQMQVRNLLHNGQAVPLELLGLIAERLRIEADRMPPFADRGIRDLYREGICGGALLAIGSAGAPRREVHVPLAHQSALAGVMMAARCFMPNGRAETSRTLISRVNILRPVDPRFVTQSAGKDSRGLCICQDPDYLAAYATKYRDTGTDGP